MGSSVGWRSVMGSHDNRHIIESMYSVFKGIRNLPITILTKSINYKYGALFGKREHEW